MLSAWPWPWFTVRKDTFGRKGERHSRHLILDYTVVTPNAVAIYLEESVKF